MYEEQLLVMNSVPEHIRKIKSYKRGEIIAREGERGTECFILVSGKVGAYRGKILITEFTKKGDIFGEMSVILEQPRSASLIALEDTDLVCVALNIDDLMLFYPSIVKKIMVNMAERLHKTTDDYLTSISLLESELKKIKS